MDLMLKLYRALKVMEINPLHRAYLSQHDPKGLEQVKEAIRRFEAAWPTHAEKAKEAS